MGKTGRLLTMGASDGPTNMAVDEALARSCRDLAILRFYNWDRPTLSLGYAQRAAEIDLVACRMASISLVRRPTGGRAVLHQHDLTYSLILPSCLPWRKLSIAESTRRINTCLRRGLELLGVPARISLGAGHSAMFPSSFCFSIVSQHEILVGGKKVIGSAQRRFPAALLQQGSILLDFDPTGLFAFVRPEMRGAMAGSLAAVGSLREAMGSPPDRVEVQSAIREGFSREMGLKFSEGALDEQEAGLADELARGRYASESWTLRR
jgi:lipoate-protein ligase A